ncbi:ABC transporter ATP-binding protein [Cesiribacter andamanensis]|uniref:Fe(3+) ions import ATP-binding protein FbpC 2 n=1 Tax=Cesiribacter andamanensis AMV16 TaxID=1279009 RepID=M7N1K7_9BACT|nr:ABC transporter ATP-binding protein [Cesiribacter andamanensis]EMR01101.1 Fe(3+) ions import ATP-binding protein FbpC 2 [Cesiribacter andamanensis AMV16]
MTFLSLSGISKWLTSQATPRQTALNSISFRLEAGQKLALAGQTGSGKSTLLKIIAGLVQPDAGSIHFKGERVKGPDEKLVAGHRSIAYLSQHFELPGSLRVEQVLQYANSLAASDAAALYALCGITPLLTRRTDQVSGGEKQRIALARLLVGKPELILLDEPFSNLDMAHKADLKEVIQSISERLGISVILVSHDPLDSLSWADQILVLQEGQLVQQASARQIYEQPKNAYVARLFGPCSLLSPPQQKGLIPLLGQPPAGKRLLLRPESLHLLSQPQPGCPAARVQRIVYYGSHFELDVELEGTQLRIRSLEAVAAPGDTVWLGLARPAVHYL